MIPAVAEMVLKIMDAFERQNIGKTVYYSGRMFSIFLTSAVNLLPESDRENRVRDSLEAVFKDVMNNLAFLEGKEAVFIRTEGGK